MRLRNDADGYGVVTKTLHWATVAALVAQLVVGYLLDDDGDDGGGRGRGRGRGEGSGRGRGRGGDDRDDDDGGLAELVDGDLDGLLGVHVALGLTILVLTVVRLLWRRLTPLPPWAPGLSAVERRLAHGTEVTLYAALLVMPATGITLLLVDDDLLWLHVASHVVFFVALALHVGLVLKHQVVDRDRLLRRML
ncbi:cytochrome b/b6 domain-containing protein [Cellulosimicrobium sp. Marseille-Q4280]|uniref:cytochrome b n=1 Tax=Cellulosimicrobium sp. Marseille-Q4280 TaxID=2937992 RepID=UPI00203AE851|nr:cytochrome b/b6 domain-containing protein [Cellulosimicrobium sp. Marseille-Q4280]